MDDLPTDGWGRREPLVEEFASMDVDDQTSSTSTYKKRLPTDHVLPGMDGVPMSELNQTYSGKGSFQMKNYYTVFDNGARPSDLLYTAIFTCPLEGEHFASGNWGANQGVKVGGAYWYKTKKQALNAAAARTLDVMSLRRCQTIERRPFRRCHDEPYLLKEDAPSLPDLPLNVKLPQKLQAVKDDVSPKRALNEWYQTFNSKLKMMGGTLTMDSPDKSCYATWMNLLKDSERRFTSVFTCPLTGERFASGTLARGADFEKDHMYYVSDENKLQFKQAFSKDDLEDGDKPLKIDFIWYKTKKEAEDAAAARAIDCLRYRYSDSNYNMREDMLIDDAPGTITLDFMPELSKYCVEKPYAVDAGSELWKTVAGSVLGVFQFDYSNDEIIPYYVHWPKLPDSSEISDEFLRNVFDMDRYAFTPCRDDRRKIQT